MLNNTLMKSNDLMVESLITLCQREGDYAVVAAELEVAGNTINQIIKRVPLPSGHPRGVGPAVRKKLDAAYPGWLLIGQTPEFDDLEFFKGLQTLLSSMPPELRGEAKRLANQAMISLLPPHTKVAPPPDDPVKKPNNAPPSH